MYQLPIDIQRKIFEFDSTYRIDYNQCMDEIPDEKIARSHKEYYNSRSPYVAHNPLICFEIDTFSGDIPYLYLAYYGFNYYGNFNKITYITTEGVKRFIYREIYNSIELARMDGIDSRLRNWEWWIILETDNNEEKICLSCEYHQVHGRLLQLYFMNTKSSLTVPIDEKDVKILNRTIRQELLNSSISSHFTYDFKDFQLNGRECIIPNALHRYYVL